MHRHLSDHSIIDSVLSRRLRSVCGAYNWILFRKPNKNCRKTGRQVPVSSAAVLWLIMRHNSQKLWTKLGCLVRLPEKICHCATKQSRLQGAKLQWSKPWCFWNKPPRESVLQRCMEAAWAQLWKSESSELPNAPWSRWTWPGLCWSWSAAPHCPIDRWARSRPRWLESRAPGSLRYVKPESPTPAPKGETRRVKTVKKDKDLEDDSAHSMCEN